MSNCDPRISIVIPAYNEEECIEECVFEVRSVMDRLDTPYEIIVVDDGSTDSTFGELRKLKSEVAQLRGIRFKRNCGQTAAMDAGLKHANGDLVATLDADMQNDPSDIPRMIEMMDKWHVVCGVRRKRSDSWLRRVSSKIANGVRNRLTHEEITDVGCTLKLYRRECLVGLKLYEGMHRFLPTLLRLDGWRVAEMPVNHRPRPRGQTKYGVWNRVFKSFRDLLAVRWMQSRWLRYEIEEEL